jgi:hypothetical protein
VQSSDLTLEGGANVSTHTHDPHALPSSVELMASHALGVGICAATLNELEKARIAAGHRLVALTKPGVVALPASIAAQQAIVGGLLVLEKDATRTLQQEVRQHPLHPWVKAQVGLGDKQVGRLLASIGDPYWSTLHERPRTVSELWAYCGFHVFKLSTGPGHCVLDAQARNADTGGPLSSSSGQGCCDAQAVSAAAAGTSPAPHPDQ